VQGARASLDPSNHILVFYHAWRLADDDDTPTSALRGIDPAQPSTAADGGDPAPAHAPGGQVDVPATAPAHERVPRSTALSDDTIGPDYVRALLCG